MITIRRALVSVFDKTGLPELGRALAAAGVEVLSTGGTARTLGEAGVAVVPVERVTGFPECLDGRVKTLHPKIHAGILADRGKTSHVNEVRELGAGLIDLVVVNLYPFEETGETPGAGRSALIEKIDIGGPTLLRAAAKNSDHVVVVCDPADYPAVIEGIGGGGISEDLSRRLARKVFARTAAYDGAIAARLQAEDPAGEAVPWPERLPLSLTRVAALRYGENPHQAGAFYRPGGLPPSGLAALRQLQGKELSYNNYLDMEAAYGLVNAFAESAAVVVKHLNPCGVGFAGDAEAAYRRALAADPVSAFGGIVALNRPLTAAAAKAMSETFLEVIIAPAVVEGAGEALAKKKNLRVVEAAPGASPSGPEIRSVSGGWLLQSPDRPHGDTRRECVTQRAPTAEEMRALERAWVMVRYAKSNAIVIADRDGMLGLGCGQTNRVDAVRQAAERAHRFEGAHKAAVLASDAFFPFRDGPDAAAAAGVSAIIQPGGSVRDEEVIAAADGHGLAMVFTGRRSFRH
jgi:phosphoribosylaminoimidazolecarboxamide formyltransferase/IMP cyclohydrolase